MPAPKKIKKKPGITYTGTLTQDMKKGDFVHITVGAEGTRVTIQSPEAKFTEHEPTPDTPTA